SEPRTSGQRSGGHNQRKPASVPTGSVTPKDPLSNSSVLLQTSRLAGKPRSKPSGAEERTQGSESAAEALGPLQAPIGSRAFTADKPFPHTDERTGSRWRRTDSK